MHREKDRERERDRETERERERQTEREREMSHKLIMVIYDAVTSQKILC